MEEVKKRLVCFDEDDRWPKAMQPVAEKRGYSFSRIPRGDDVRCKGGGLGFFHPSMNPARLAKQRNDYRMMRDFLTMVQDGRQVGVYEDKSRQFALWADYMPGTWYFQHKDEALAWLEANPHETLVSKAKEGASSYNVRVITGADKQRRHIEDVFAGRVVVIFGGRPQPYNNRQNGYVLLQEFIPNHMTYRVNFVGRKVAIFHRFNYPDRPVAQTGNVAPLMELDEEHAALIEFCKGFVLYAGDSKWIALDVLRDPRYPIDDFKGWRLLETSLAWPWPSPGKCDDAPFFGSKRQWREMWDVMLDEYEAGAWLP